MQLIKNEKTGNYLPRFDIRHSTGGWAVDEFNGTNFMFVHKGTKKSCKEYIKDRLDILNPPSIPEAICQQFLLF